MKQGVQGTRGTLEVQETSPMSNRKPWWMLLGLTTIVVTETACLDLIGYRDHEVGDPFGEGGAGGETGGAGATGATGGGGAGATGGAGGTGGGLCEPGAMAACYSGPPGTEVKGACQPGQQTCSEDGSGFGECVGEVLPAAETCGTTVDDDCDGKDCAVWSRIWGDGGDPFVIDIETDDQGNVAVLGMLIGSMNIQGQMLEDSASSGSPFLVKLDKDGNLVWAKTLGDELSSSVHPEMALDPQGNILIAADLTGEIDFGGGVLADPGGPHLVLAKLGPDGGHLWSNTYGGATFVAVEDLAVDLLGDPLVIGRYNGTLDLGFEVLMGAGGQDLFVAKFDASIGLGVWAKGYGDGAAQNGFAAAADTDGNLVLTGANNGTINFGGDDLTAPSPDFSAAFVAKLAGADGSHIWSRSYSTSCALQITDVAIDAAGNAFLGGTFCESVTLGDRPLTASGQSDALLAKLGPDGQHVWSQRYGSASYESVSSIEIDKTNGAGSIFVGVTGGSSIDFGGGSLFGAGGEDVFLAKLDSAGQHIWSRQLGDAGQQRDALFAAGPMGLFVACDVDGVVSFGDSVLSAAGKTDVALARLTP